MVRAIKTLLTPFGLGFAVLVIGLNSHAQIKFGFSGNWRISLDGQQASDEESNQRSQTTLRLNSSLDFKANDWLSLNVSPSVKSRAGFIQANPNAQTEENAFDLKNASVDLKPWLGAKFSAGSLNQKVIHSPLIMSDRSFPAARVLIGMPADSFFQSGVIAQTAIPTSVAYTSNSQDAESTPQFNSGLVYVGIRNADIDSRFSVGSYRFQDLPLSVSSKSFFLGNQGSQINATDYKFDFDFQGIEARFDLNWKITRNIIYVIESSYVQNQSAPSDTNAGVWAKNDVKFIFGDRWAFIPGFEYFRIEPNAVVAAYNDEGLNANRTGLFGKLAVQWNNLISFAIKAGNRVAIFQNPTIQPDEKNIMLSVETVDVAF
jgi:hypothetical protein